MGEPLTWHEIPNLDNDSGLTFNGNGLPTHAGRGAICCTRSDQTDCSLLRAATGRSLSGASRMRCRPEWPTKNFEAID